MSLHTNPPWIQMSLWGTFGKFHSGSEWFLCTSLPAYFFKLLFRFTVWQRSVSACTNQNAAETLPTVQPCASQTSAFTALGDLGRTFKRKVTVQTAKPACHLRSNIATTLYFKEAYCFKPFVFCSCWRVKNLYPRSVISIWLYSMLSFKG